VCGFESGRDVIAMLNLEKKYLTSKGLASLAPMPIEPSLEVAVLFMKRWVRRMSLDETLRTLK
jgi:transposase